jgi:signal transduction histidine kinase
MSDEQQMTTGKPVHMTIRRGLALAFGAVLSLLLLIYLVAWLFINQLGENLDNVATKAIPRLVQARDLVMANDGLAAVAGQIILADDLDELRRLQEFGRQASQQLLKDLLRPDSELIAADQQRFLQQTHLQIDRKLIQLAEQVEWTFDQRTEIDSLAEQLLVEIRQSGLSVLADGQQADFFSARRNLMLAVDLLRELERLIYQTVSAETLQKLEQLEGNYNKTTHQLRTLFAALGWQNKGDKYPVHHGRMIEDGISLISLQRGLLERQARAAALHASCVQLSAQFRLLCTRLVRESTAQVKSIREATQADIAARKSFFVVMVLLSLAVSAGLVYFIGHRRMVKPLSRLAQSMGELEQGLAPLQRVPDGVREIDRLALSFSRMSATLAGRDQDLRQLQALLRNVIDSLSPLLLAVDQNCCLVLWNLPAEKFCGGHLQQGMSAERALGWLPVDFGRVKQAVSNQQSLQLKQLTVTQDEQPRIFELNCVPLHAEPQQGAVLRVEDVTERLRIERTIAQSEKMMSIGGLAAGVAHEINNPLAGIMQSAQVLENRLNSGLKRNQEIAVECQTDMQTIALYLDKRGIPGLLQGIRSSANQAAKIVSNMLTFSRSNSVIEKPSFEMINLVDLVENTLQLLSSDFDLRQGYDFRRIRLQREFAEALPAVNCEGTLIQQVVFNILKNSAQAFSGYEDGQAEPHICLSLLQAGDSVQLRIADNGPGMSKEVRQRIFEPFYTTKGVGHGTGLGMSVAYFIVTEYHQGSIEVDSEPGRGTTFTICLPIDQRAAAE